MKDDVDLQAHGLQASNMSWWKFQMFLKWVATKNEKLILRILPSYVMKMYTFNPSKTYKQLWWWNFQGATDCYFDINKSCREHGHSVFLCLEALCVVCYYQSHCKISFFLVAIPVSFLPHVIYKLNKKF